MIVAALPLGWLPLTAAAQELDGVWQTDGYGQVISVEKGRLARYETTKISCIADLTATLEAGSEVGHHFRYVGSGVNADTGVQDVLLFETTTDADRASVQVEGTVAPIGLRRLAVLPEICAREPDISPSETYRVFWQTFAENYPFFALRHYDWVAANERFRPEVTARTTAAELFGILRRMISPLQDAHTLIETRTTGLEFGGYRPPPGRGEELTTAERKRIFAAAEQYLVPGQPLREFCQGKLQYGRLRGGLGYLRILSFEDFSKAPSIASQRMALESALDTIFADKGLKGLVIDSRLNGGGSDVFALDVASRLTDRSYLAYKKIARNDPDRVAFTPPRPVLVPPTDRVRFAGAVVLLTSIDSESAAETFAMALMGRCPRVVRIGDNTQGVFSDVLIRRLPNGWTIGLPNEEYLTEDGVSFDATGVPPDIRVPVFSSTDLLAGRDPALRVAVRLLRNGSRAPSGPIPSGRRCARSDPR